MQNKTFAIIKPDAIENKYKLTDEQRKNLTETL